MDFGMDYQGGGGGGGGFDSGGGGGGFGGGSQGSGNRGGGRRSYDEQTMIPVTIRMAWSAQPDDSADGTGSLRLQDGRSLYHVKLVAAVRSFEDFSTNVVYHLEDGTGLIEVKQWLDDTSSSASEELRQQTLKDNTYVKVVGQIKEYDGKKSIVADSVRPLSTGNELTHHMLEVVYSGETHKRRESFVPSAQKMGIGSGVGFGTPSHSAPARSGAPLMSATGTGNELKDAVLRFIRREGEQSEVGANVQRCIQILTADGRFNESQVRKVIDDLSAEGHIYSTINEDNYKYAL